jgi:hypothetical protein
MSRFAAVILALLALAGALLATAPAATPATSAASRGTLVFAFHPL